MRSHFLTTTLPLLVLSLTFLASVGRATSILTDDEFDVSTLPYTITLYASPLIPSSGTKAPPPPTPYGTISYNPSTLQALFTPSTSPSPPADVPLTKLGLYDSDSKRWRSAVVAATEKLAGGCVMLHLGAGEGDQEVRHVSFAAAGPEGQIGGVGARVVRAAAGPRPVLSQPVVLDESGKEPEPEVEKTFLQKYWWIFLAAAMLIITSGGPDEGK
ncbi:MAG: hypothetical protein M1839_007641 [Geoglossum umbratile]|nr:MAG: hypothetical protein M1839_007641 [Geoglossum umbratile]